jgi:hypothetical protein
MKREKPQGKSVVIPKVVVKRGNHYGIPSVIETLVNYDIVPMKITETRPHVVIRATKPND